MAPEASAVRLAKIAARRAFFETMIVLRFPDLARAEATIAWIRGETQSRRDRDSSAAKIDASSPDDVAAVATASCSIISCLRPRPKFVTDDLLPARSPQQGADYLDMQRANEPVGAASVPFPGSGVPRARGDDRVPKPGPRLGDCQAPASSASRVLTRAEVMCSRYAADHLMFSEIDELVRDGTESWCAMAWATDLPPLVQHLDHDRGSVSTRR
jgi:hypothetical protein